MNPSLDATFALLRSRILLRLQDRGWPSMASPFCEVRLTHGE
ncbi:hypothetical protein [Halomonas kalidii]|uniref:Uncharacterized protein n=1 Tax=Halomonas kalidii TaxID=3043293 RepID=A0ABT6VEZ1_9GAMM|nr:hypothetical protein [Halomonas kalidii]MDI5932546.1 hypothetical protein [Halomonas kalidii]